METRARGCGFSDESGSVENRDLEKVDIRRRVDKGNFFGEVRRPRRSSRPKGSVGNVARSFRESGHRYRRLGRRKTNPHHQQKGRLGRWLSFPKLPRDQPPSGKRRQDPDRAHIYPSKGRFRIRGPDERPSSPTPNRPEKKRGQNVWRQRGQCPPTLCGFPGSRGFGKTTAEPKRRGGCAKSPDPFRSISLWWIQDKREVLPSSTKNGEEKNQAFPTAGAKEKGDSKGGQKQKPSS